MMTKNERDGPFIGRVTSRKCPVCGHSEIGILKPNGAFLALSPGTRIQVLEDISETHSILDPPSEPIMPPAIERSGKKPSFSPWTPEPFRGDRSLIQKFGVMIPDNERNQYPMNGERYRTAYMEKLRHLLEKEIHVPLPVILDQRFTSPHLASGDPKQIVLHMWEELEEIRVPVLRMTAWLKAPDENTLSALIRPITIDEIQVPPLSEIEIRQALDTLTLEAFLNLL